MGPRKCSPESAQCNDGANVQVAKLRAKENAKRVRESYGLSTYAAGRIADVDHTTILAWEDPLSWRKNPPDYYIELLHAHARTRATGTSG